VGAEVFHGSIHVEAPPEEVFAYFTEAEALASWMGDRAIVEPRPGGVFVIHFDDRVVEGRYVVVDFPRHIVVTWGRHGSVRLPPGGSTLEVTFTPEGTGTRVSVVHDGLPDPERALHALGWAHYLPRLAAAAGGKPLDAHHVPAHLTEGAD
jgi:uncharacterized protein YndB with AHSA1/START domain